MLVLPVYTQTSRTSISKSSPDYHQPQHSQLQHQNQHRALIFNSCTGVLADSLALFMRHKANQATRLSYSSPIPVFRKECVPPLRGISHHSQRRISEPPHRTHMSMPRLVLCLTATINSLMVKWSFEENWVSELNPKYSLVYQSLADIVVWLSDYVFEPS
jgi:hypothetical protein